MYNPYPPSRPEDPDHTGEIDLRDFPVAAFLVDGARRIVGWNGAAEQLLGYSAADVRGQLCSEVFCPESARLSEICRSHCNLLRRRVTPHPSSVDLMVRRRDGSPRRVLLRTAIAGAGSSHPRVLHVVDDLEERPAAQLFQRSIHAVEQPPQLTDGPRLSSREIEVLRMLGDGRTVETIAAELSISQITVRNHLTHAMDKLGVNSRLHAVLAAHRLGLI